MPPTSESSFIGIELCGTTLRAATVDNEGVIGERREGRMETENLSRKLARWSTICVRTANNIAAVGIAIPGLVNRQTDRVIASNYLPGITSRESSRRSNEGDRVCVSN